MSAQSDTITGGNGQNRRPRSIFKVEFMKYFVDFTALALLYAFVFLKRWKSCGKYALFINTVFYVYLASVLYFTMMPVITALPFVFNHPYKPMNLVPFSDVLNGRGDFVRQVVLNVLMTVPFGVLFPLTRYKTGANFLKTVLFCFLMSLGIELLQPLINGTRAPDITDIITNTLGGAIGYVIYMILRPIVNMLRGDQNGNK